MCSGARCKKQLSVNGLFRTTLTETLEWFKHRKSSQSSHWFTGFQQVEQNSTCREIVFLSCVHPAAVRKDFHRSRRRCENKSDSALNLLPASTTHERRPKFGIDLSFLNIRVLVLQLLQETKPAVCVSETLTWRESALSFGRLMSTVCVCVCVLSSLLHRWRSVCWWASTSLWK